MASPRLTPRPRVPLLVHAVSLGAILVPDLGCKSNDAPTNCHTGGCDETTVAGETGASQSEPTTNVAPTIPCAHDSNPDDCDTSVTGPTASTSSTTGTDTGDTTDTGDPTDTGTTGTTGSSTGTTGSSTGTTGSSTGTTG